MIEVVHRGGVLLPGPGLWLDPHRKQAAAFVSHAHADHFEPHDRIWCSEATAHLIQGRYRPTASRLEPLPFGVPTDLGQARLTLLPAGHILGSAQAWIETDGGTLLYTGDFKLRPGLAAEPCELRQAETLIMETTFGLPHFRFPPAERVRDAILRFCFDTLAEPALPVLIGYSLGKAQEIQRLLTQAGLRPALHETVYRMALLCRQWHPDFPEPRKWEPTDRESTVLIVPPNTARSRWLRMLGPIRTAMLSGWALAPGAIHRYQVDAAFPLSDHADFPELCQLVEQVNPVRVLTLHGYAAEFAAHLRAQGREAWALTGQNQLELALPLGHAPGHPDDWAEPGAVQMEDSAFGAFADLGEAVANESSRTAKIDRLARYLRELPMPDLEAVARWLTGRPLSVADPRSLQTGWALLRRALLRLDSAGEADLRAWSRQFQDAALTTTRFLRGKTRPMPHRLEEVRQFFDQLADDRSPVVRAQRLADWLLTCSPAEAACTLKLLTGDLRIGLKAGLVEEALAVAFHLSAEAVREAHMTTGDLGETARLAKEGRASAAVPVWFRPLRVMLASPEPDATAVYERLAGEAGEAGEIGIWTEPKYDGIRLQAHVSDGRVALYSRDLHEVTGQFPEIAAAFSGWPSVILDGELVAHDGDRLLPFQELQRRLGRKEPDLFLTQETPLRYLLFDLLAWEGRSLLRESLTVRRATLEALPCSDSLVAVPVAVCRTVSEVETAFVRARAMGAEGLICKSTTSFYRPGRRGQAWLKLKGVMTTLDVVVVAVEQGHGKRHDLLSDYTFAVRDEINGELPVIGKAYSGLTDAELITLGERFRAATIRERGRKRLVQPEVVLEVAFDRIQPSLRHASGLALRFPRIVRVRTDKRVEEIDTLATARKLAGVENEETRTT